MSETPTFRSPLGLHPGTIVKLCDRISVRIETGLVAEHQLVASGYVEALILDGVTPAQRAKLIDAYTSIVGA